YVLALRSRRCGATRSPSRTPSAADHESWSHQDLLALVPRRRRSWSHRDVHRSDTAAPVPRVELAAQQGVGAARPEHFRTVVAFWQRALRAVAVRSAAGSSTPIR